MNIYSINSNYVGYNIEILNVYVSLWNKICLEVTAN